MDLTHIVSLHLAASPNQFLVSRCMQSLHIIGCSRALKHLQSVNRLPCALDTLWWKPWFRPIVHLGNSNLQCVTGFRLRNTDQSRQVWNNETRGLMQYFVPSSHRIDGLCFSVERSCLAWNNLSCLEEEVVFGTDFAKGNRQTS